ncbi:aminotransferase class I/II-fold pyridoxal phosphate-dependent enzyme [Agaribacter flavus]|uniref:8-amino-7-oxononanoate synthase n=1 Tax=Agaribacter flavus TaxID=1902781 RepID=A0ABV7FQG1_9ALTE
MSFHFIQDANAKRKANGLFRRRVTISEVSDSVIKIDGNYFINFASNDYLGLSQHTEVLQAYVEGLSLYGASSSSSPVVSGYTQAHASLESALAELCNQESVMLLSSGFAANQAVCQALSQGEPRMKNDLGIVSDKLMHASFVEAASSQAASFKRFAHNDVDHAQRQLQSLPSSNKLLASEGVFSMDGDSAPVADLVTLKSSAQALLMLDEAHSFGVVGEQGLGYSGSYQYAHEKQAIDITMGTFGKAIGTQGAFLAGSKELIDYLVNFARHYVYSTAPAAAIARATLKALDIMLKGKERAQLHQNIASFKALMGDKQITLMPSDSAIQPILVENTEKLMLAKDKLSRLGILVSAIRTPTVPKGSERLRITLSALHSNEDIHALVDALEITRDAVGGFA